MDSHKIDLKSVRTLLYGVRIKWKDIGIELNLPIESLNTIEGRYNDPGKCLLLMIEEWLKSRQVVTWWDLKQALEARAVNEWELAQKGTIAECGGVAVEM